MKRRLLRIVLGMAAAVCVAWGMLHGTAVFVHADTTVNNETEFRTANNSDGTMILGADITLTGNNATFSHNTVLDLNGHTLTTGSNTILVSSGLTVRDNSAGQTGKITGTGLRRFPFQVQNGGHLTLTSGTVEGSDCGIRVLSGGELTVNGGTITASQYSVYDEGSVTVNGGTITASGYPAIQVKGTDKNTNMLTVNGGTIRALGSGAAINLHSNCAVTINGGTIEATYNVGGNPIDGGSAVTAFGNTSLTVTGGTLTGWNFAIAGSGVADPSNANYGGYTDFTITGGTLTALYGTAVYAPQVHGVTTITGGTLTGSYCGVEIRAGSLTVTGGTITGNQNEYAVYDDNSLYSLTKGCAVAIAQHTTEQPIDVNISGGSFYGKVPVAQNNVWGFTDENVLAGLTYSISGGAFYSSGDTDVSIENLPNGPFISGGTFSKRVNDAYLTTEQYLVNGRYVVSDTEPANEENGEEQAAGDAQQEEDAEDEEEQGSGVRGTGRSGSGSPSNPDALFPAFIPAGSLNLAGNVKLGKQIQGYIAQAVFKMFLPKGWKEIFTFNMTVDDKADYSLKKGALSFPIPSQYRSPGRQFQIMGLDEKGGVHYFPDTDSDPDTLTVRLELKGYAFDLIYTDTQP